MFGFLAVSVLVGQVAANCAHGTSLFPRLPNVTVSTFGYTGQQGPLDWFGLNQTANSACDKGLHQSPININSTISIVNGTAFNWTVQDYPQGTTFENLGTNVEVLVNGSLVDSISGISYKLSQFHIHTPAEHRINNEFYPMEMHWVFESADQEFAVVAFIVELCENAGCTDPVLEAVFSAVGDIASPGEAVTSAPLAFGELIDKFSSSTAYRYNGSLTTPPCTENVDWLISTQLLSIDLPTWLSVKKVIKYNARYTQNSLGAVNLLQNAADELNGQNASSTKPKAEI